MEVGEEGDYNYTYRCTVTTRMTPAFSDESHLNVSLIVREKVTNHNLFFLFLFSSSSFVEEKGELKRNRTEVLPLTSLTPHR